MGCSTYHNPIGLHGLYGESSVLIDFTLTVKMEIYGAERVRTLP
jgi:hypothetical protein